MVVMLLLLVSAACRKHDARSTGPSTGGSVGNVPVSARASRGEPALVLDATTHDFGLVNEGDPLRHVFHAMNRGSAPLLLSEARTTCGCTVALLPEAIPPGGSGPIEVTMDSHGERGAGGRTITFSSNDPHRPRADLEIKYDIEPLLRLDRAFVLLTSTRGRTHVERAWLTGTLAGQTRPQVGTLECSGLVTARTVDDRTGGRSRKGIELKLVGRRPASGECHLTLKTGLPNPAELYLPFRYEVH
jgi:hypothetical protein